jgi:hypothetical protein
MSENAVQITPADFHHVAVDMPQYRLVWTRRFFCSQDRPKVVQTDLRQDLTLGQDSTFR